MFLHIIWLNQLTNILKFIFIFMRLNECMMGMNKKIIERKSLVLNKSFQIRLLFVESF